MSEQLTIGPNKDLDKGYFAPFKMWTYGAKRHSELGKFRRMAWDEATALRYGDHVWFIATDGTARQVKINGAVKRWKRDAQRFEIPVKYGMYEYSYFRNEDLPRMLIRIG